MSQKRDGKWIDSFGACRICDGEIPHGHSNNCDYFKLETRNRELVQAMGRCGAIGERIRTQDNRITENPMFCVQVLRRDYGYDPYWCSDFVWMIDGDEVQDEVPGAIKVGFRERWETVMAAFTEEGCEEHLKLNGHNYRGKVRIYVESFNRCPEMIAVREAIATLNKEMGKEG